MINRSRVFIGGLAAGVVLNVIDFISNSFILGTRMTAEMNSVAPGLSEKMMAGSNAAGFIIMDFIIGVLMVWMYAAVRPRLGAGPRTASVVAGFFWLIGALFYWPWTALGLMTMSTYWMAGLIQVVNVLAAANAGAMLYKEEMA